MTLGCVNEEPDIEIGRQISTAPKAKLEVLFEDVVIYEGAPPSD